MMASKNQQTAVQLKMRIQKVGYFESVRYFMLMSTAKCQRLLIELFRGILLTESIYLKHVFTNGENVFKKIIF